MAINPNPSLKLLPISLPPFVLYVGTRRPPRTTVDSHKFVYWDCNCQCLVADYAGLVFELQSCGDSGRLLDLINIDWIILTIRQLVNSHLTFLNYHFVNLVDPVSLNAQSKMSNEN